MSELANSFLSAYEGQTSDIQSQLNELLDKNTTAFETKQKANELVEAVGSIKAFVSGQPVGKFLLEKGKAFVKDSGISKEGAEADAEGEAEGINELGDQELSNFADIGPTTISSSEAIPDMVASRAEALASNYGESSTVVPETAFPTVPTLGTEVGSAEVVSSSSEGVLAGQSELLGEVSSVVKESANISKSVAGAVGGEEGGELAGEEAVAGAFDEIPVIGILGLLVGGGLAISAAIKKPHLKTPVDNINASYQVGI